MTLWKQRLFGKPAIALAALAAGSMAVATPAEAHGRRGGDDAAIAIGAGVVGLALGAAIASSDNDRDVYVRYESGPRYYGGGYYRPYPVYRAYPVYRPYPAWRGYDPRYEEWRRWRKHERWEHRRGWRGW